MPDHPRIRGEHSRPLSPSPLGSGSSPHTRGALRRDEHHEVVRRIIPAYAGSTSRTPPAQDRCWDHPRIRGEHRGGASGTDDIPGSSPHTRGAQGRPKGQGRSGRIIPAYAGSTPPHGPRRRELWDHPRIRGEHGSTPSTPDESMGSSPHTRGALADCGNDAMQERIIPAYAGSTPMSAPASRSRDGSSPHTRGAPVAELPNLAQNRIIPAYAGSTRTFCAGGRRARDHPRIRGEHLSQPAADLTSIGSSPHTRGALHPTRRENFHSGIIPAYAGSTPRPDRRRGS